MTIIWGCCCWPSGWPLHSAAVCMSQKHFVYLLARLGVADLRIPRITIVTSEKIRSNLKMLCRYVKDLV